jgi:curli biogenesis system outer membrane secretion channel CsgG
MNNRNGRMIAALGMIFLLFFGCVEAQKATRPATEAESGTGVAAIGEVPKTLAILPFENNSVTEPERFAPLSKGLSAMLTTDLKNAGTTLKLLEREQIQAMLKEVALSQSGSVDQSTAVRVGRMLGAQAIAFGSFMVLGTDVRMDLRIVKVETSEMLMAESIVGSSDAFIDLERKLAGKIAGSLKIALQPATAGTGSDINAALYFSQGLDALDRGDKPGAGRLFAKAIALDPAYKSQVDNALGKN